jgi:serine/threonine protein kinase
MQPHCRGCHDQSPTARDTRPSLSGTQSKPSCQDHNWSRQICSGCCSSLDELLELRGGKEQTTSDSRMRDLVLVAIHVVYENTQGLRCFLDAKNFFCHNVIPSPSISRQSCGECGLDRSERDENREDLIRWDAIETARERPYIVMEYIRGNNLGNILKKGKVTPGEAARYIQEATEAVQYAHEHYILHRDIKPTNLMLDENSGRVRLTDCGLARPIGEATRLTKTGLAVGSPSYMCPEQANGDAKIDGRTDVYSLGATLYALLTGRAPFKSVDEVRSLDVRRPRRHDGTIPKKLETICLACLEKLPENRPYRTARSLARDLGQFFADKPIRASDRTRSQ